MTTRTRQVLINNCNSTIVPLSVDYSRYPLHCIPIPTDMLSDKSPAGPSGAGEVTGHPVNSKLNQLPPHKESIARLEIQNTPNIKYVWYV